MARIRTIKPEFWEDEKAGALDPLAALTFIGLISLADDEGRGRATLTFLRSRLHPYRGTEVALIEDSLRTIYVSGLAVPYFVDGQSYYVIPKFKIHQVINRPTPSKLPAPPSRLTEDSVSTPEDSLRERNGMERKGRERNGTEWSGVPSSTSATVASAAAPAPSATASPEETDDEINRRRKLAGLPPKS